jgi:hypothetical protein
MLLVGLAALWGLAAAGCGAADEPAPVAGSGTGDAGAGAGVLSGTCPDPLVIQTDWFPEAEYGAVYNLVGDDYEIDTGDKAVSGSLVAGGDDTGIDIEVRAGGPAIGSEPPRVQMYTDRSIHLGFTDTDSQIVAWEDAPLVAVVAPLEKNPQMIQWDPATYPDVEGIADIGEQQITVNVFAGDVFYEYFVAEGIWSADQVDPSYDGSPARFITEGGAIAQQGFASAEPYNYQHVFEEWGRPVAFELLHDAGFQVYSQALGVRPGDLEDLRPCLERVVPIVQQSAVDFLAEPERASAIIVDAVARYDTFWVYDEDLARFSVAQQRELGLVGNGGNGTLGDMDRSRFEAMLFHTDVAGIEHPDDLAADDLFTNDLIDPTIGL